MDVDDAGNRTWGPKKGGFNYTRIKIKVHKHECFILCKNLMVPCIAFNLTEFNKIGYAQHAIKSFSRIQ